MKRYLGNFQKRWSRGYRARRETVFGYDTEIQNHGRVNICSRSM